VGYTTNLNWLAGFKPSTVFFYLGVYLDWNCWCLFSGHGIDSSLWNMSPFGEICVVYLFEPFFYCGSENSNKILIALVRLAQIPVILGTGQKGGYTDHFCLNRKPSGVEQVWSTQTGQPSMTDWHVSGNTVAMKSLNEKNLDLRVITEGKEISLKICWRSTTNSESVEVFL